MTQPNGGADLHQLDLNLHPNEASGLLAIEDEPLLEAHGWEYGFWAVLDEGRVEDCVAAIGHERGAGIDEGWEIDRFHAEPKGDVGKTEDSEAIARYDGWVYVFGSHFGSKDGPLQPKRGFVARFREDEIKYAFEDPAVGMEIYRDSFALHRLINDALKEDGPPLIPLGPESRKALIEGTIERGEEKNKGWAGLVREGDYPLNFEGAAFRPGGTLLLGLRFPTSAEGHPVLVEIEGIERLFEPGAGMPSVRGFWTVDAVGRDGEMAGVRDLALAGDELHLVTGNIDSRKGGSVLIKDYPPGRATVATHFRCTLPETQNSVHLKADFVREFPGLPRVEGIAVTDDGRFFYVTDEDEGVHLRLTQLLGS
jgi:hypothetical protein